MTDTNEKKHFVGKAALSILAIMVFLLLFNAMSSYGWLPEAVGMISDILLIISTVLLVFPGLPYLAYQRKLKSFATSKEILFLLTFPIKPFIILINSIRFKGFSTGVMKSEMASFAV
ncbi:hypothetical protein F6Y03_04930 [Bacillus megaterium]|nr:hypothetical protein [Priestia megaterium]